MGILRRSTPLALVTCLAMLAAACGDDSDDSSEDSAGDPDETAETTGDPLLISTELGEVQGTDSDVEGVRAFLDIPYAAEPSGENRWRTPQPREPYGDVLDATEPGPSCPQDVGGSTAGMTEIPDSDEDCLGVSVWAPEDADGLPVMFWIYGGGFRAGSAHQPYYIGDQMASHGAVVVNVNYRLGPFGFLATEELAEESDDGSYGNYGIADQTAGLEWVRDNIEAFGGDPDNVTIFGESAGGGSVCAHMASSLSEGLFHKAIVQSGGTCDRLDDGEEAKAAGALALDLVGCDDMDCMRELDTETLLEEIDMFGPPGDEPTEGPRGGPLVDDGVRYVAPAAERAEAGELDGIEVLMGANAEEAWTFLLSRDDVMEDDELHDTFARFTDDTEALLDLYPAEDYDDNNLRYQDMWTDVSFVCPTLTWAERATENDVYLYHFDYVGEQIGLPPGHGLELGYLFGHPEGSGASDIPLEEEVDLEFSEAMQAAWVSFATTGDPGEAWSSFSESGQVTLLADDEIGPVEPDELSEGRCETVSDLTDASANLI